MPVAAVPLSVRLAAVLTVEGVLLAVEDELPPPQPTSAPAIVVVRIYLLIFIFQSSSNFKKSNLAKPKSMPNDDKLFWFSLGIRQGGKTTTFSIRNILHQVTYRFMSFFQCVSPEHVPFSKEKDMPRKTKTTVKTSLGVRIGCNIKIVRIRLGITQSQLAETLDLENVTVSRIETGVQLPSIDRLEEIVKALKVSLTA